MRVSNSQIGCFKACRRMYELRYVYGLEPVEKAETLSRGLSFHEGVEKLLKGEMSVPHSDDPKINAMLKTFWDRTCQGLCVKDVEKWFEYKTSSGHTVIGRMDAVAENGRVIEHKTTSGLIDGEYFARLEMDEQIPTYMIAAKTGAVIYTVCSTPSIRQKKGEKDDEFAARCVEWFNENPDEKFKVEVLHRSAEQLETFAIEQDAVINEMADCKVFYRNPSHCMKWGRMCEYAPICMHYDPLQEYIEFKKREMRKDEG